MAMELDELIEAINSGKKHGYAALFLIDDKPAIAHKVLDWQDNQCEYCEGSGYVIIDSRENEADCPACDYGSMGAPTATVCALGDDHKFIVAIDYLTPFLADVCPCGDTTCDWGMN